MKKVGVMIFVLLLLAAGSYYFFLNYPAATYAILGLNYSANSTLTQENTSIISNLTSVNSTSNSEILNLTPVNTTSNSASSSINNSATSEVVVTASSSSNSSTYDIAIANFIFSSNVLTIHSGDTVFWMNQEDVLHHLISDSGNEIDSSLLYPGQSYSHTFANKGSFSYHDFVHPSLNGTIIVE